MAMCVNLAILSGRLASARIQRPTEKTSSVQEAPSTTKAPKKQVTLISWFSEKTRDGTIKDWDWDILGYYNKYYMQLYGIIWYYM